MVHSMIPLLMLAIVQTTSATQSLGLPFVINTWSGPFIAATDSAFATLLRPNATAIDAVEAGCTTCERNQCDGTVGYGGSPDEQCETTLDAMIMDGTTFNAGAVAGLRRIKDATSVARKVMEWTAHTMLSGDLATRFAIQEGFVEEDLSTPESRAQCAQWKDDYRMPNYKHSEADMERKSLVSMYNKIRAGYDIFEAGMEELPAEHDTISMIAIDVVGNIAAGTSTNGLSHKVPGRVGDGPIVGSGSYADSDVGGCGATGDGDIMMRFLPCYQAVENLRLGMSPTEAAEDAVRRMLRKFPKISTGVIVVDKEGRHAGAGSGWTFTYSFRGPGMKATQVVEVPPLGMVASGGLTLQP